MSPQLSIGYEPGYVGADAWRHQLEAIRSAVNHLGLKEVSFALDVSGSMLSDALNERDRKRWAAEWTHVVLAMLSRRAGDQIAESLVRLIAETAILTTHLALEGEAEISRDELAVAMAAIAKLRRKGRR